MELKKSIKERRTIRRFRNQKIPREVVIKLIDYAQWAPSACNLQLWRFIAIDNDDIKEEIVAKAGSNRLLAEAPLVIVVLYQKGFRESKKAHIQSAGAAIQNILLVAHEEGIGGVWLAGIANTEKIKEILRISEHFEVIACLGLGYPDETSEPPPRKAHSDILSFNKSDITYQIYPTTLSPDQWTLEQIKRFRNDSVRATSPLIPRTYDRTINNEISIALDWARPGRILEILPFRGEYTAELCSKIEGEYIISELSESPVYFTQKRIGANRVKTVIAEGFNLPFPDDSLDTVFCFKKLETLPRIYRKSIIKEVHRVLNPNGVLIISFNNYMSLYSLYYLKIRFVDKIEVPNTGPFAPISFGEIKNVLDDFHIEEIRGITLAPWQSGKVVTGALSKYCVTIILKCSKNKER